MGIVSDITGGIFGSGAGAANKAADAQARSAGQAMDVQERTRAETIGRLEENLQPFVRAGQGQIEGINSLVTDPIAQRDFIQNNPFFDALADDSQRRLFNNQAARGKVGSGQTAEALQNSILLLGNDLLSQNIQQRSQIADRGLNAATNDASIFANTGTNSANAISDLFTQQGNARAAGQIGSFNAQRGELNNAINTGLGLAQSGLFGGSEGGSGSISSLFGGSESNPLGGIASLFSGGSGAASTAAAAGNAAAGAAGGPTGLGLAAAGGPGGGVGIGGFGSSALGGSAAPTFGAGNAAGSAVFPGIAGASGGVGAASTASAAAAGNAAAGLAGGPTGLGLAAAGGPGGGVGSGIAGGATSATGGGAGATAGAVAGPLIGVAVLAMIANGIKTNAEEESKGRKGYQQIVNSGKWTVSPAGISGIEFKDPVTGRTAWMSPEAAAANDGNAGSQGFLLSDAGDGLPGLWHPVAGVMTQSEQAKQRENAAEIKAQDKGFFPQSPDGKFKPGFVGFNEAER